MRNNCAAWDYVICGNAITSLVVAVGLTARAVIIVSRRRVGHGAFSTKTDHIDLLSGRE
jgi:hypothetical protein